MIKWEGEEEEYATWESYDEVKESWCDLLDEWEFKLKNMKANDKNKSVISADDHINNIFNHTNNNNSNSNIIAQSELNNYVLQELIIFIFVRIHIIYIARMIMLVLLK